MKDVACVLLAAGLSTRMGRPKLLVRMGEKTVFEVALLNHVASSLSSICAVVAGWTAEFGPISDRYADDRVTFIQMPRPCRMSDSLKAGWKASQESVRPDAVMISLADQPLVTPSIIDRLVAAYRDSGSTICVPAYGNRWGHPVIIDSRLGDEIMQVEGDRGAREVLSRHRDLVKEIPFDTDAVIVDVDTDEDLGRIRSRSNPHE